MFPRSWPRGYGSPRQGTAARGTTPDAISVGAAALTAQGVRTRLVLVAGKQHRTDKSALAVTGRNGYMVGVSAAAEMNWGALEPLPMTPTLRPAAPNPAIGPCPRSDA